jgi:hypothetical protein
MPEIGRTELPPRRVEIVGRLAISVASFAAHAPRQIVLLVAAVHAAQPGDE